MSDDYPTDNWLMDLFKDWHDPCPLRSQKDGLLEEWRERTFINPPYSNPKPFVLKAIRSNREYKNTIVLLLKMDSSTAWFTALQEAGAQFLWVNKRLKFRTGKSAPFPSMLAILKGGETCQRSESQKSQSLLQYQ